MNYRPVPLCDRARAAMQPALERGNVDWPQVEAWLAEGSAQVWEVNGGQAYVLTVLTEHEVEGVLAGGTGAREWAAAFGRAMRARPEHQGRTLSVTGRRGWQRLLSDWQRDGEELRY